MRTHHYCSIPYHSCNVRAILKTKVKVSVVARSAKERDAESAKDAEVR